MVTDLIVKGLVLIRKSRNIHSIIKNKKTQIQLLICPLICYTSNYVNSVKQMKAMKEANIIQFDFLINLFQPSLIQNNLKRINQRKNRIKRKSQISNCQIDSSYS
ncbi:unnamed protein product [Paramecium sonneborni]|uniref:Uncharacterized protein n=1 Tax=Paramecium sonneborni TaxID=65129 RepID=A0A8S1PZZ4_9CILI|nr:unnamed protein product [Paramecium sonneborni]